MIKLSEDFKMGRFEGLSNEQWVLIEPLLPKEPEKQTRGYPHAPWKKICNSIFWILITGSRWCDLPKGKQWGARTTSHRWLGVWQEDGTLEKMLKALLESANLAGLLNWERLASDGFFFRGERGR